MTTKYKIIIAAVVGVVSFAFGRYTASVGTIKTVTDTNIADNTKTNKDTQQTTVTNTVKKPDGEVDTTTTTRTDTVVNTDENKDTTQHQVQTVTSPKTDTLNVSVMAGLDVRHGPPTGVYGASVNKQLLGPVTIGVWGLTDGTLGGSLGLNF